jgi:hypothetical protein
MHQIMSERVERLSFGMSLTTAALALQLDVIINRDNEIKFKISGLKQSGRPVIGPPAQCAAGRSIVEAVLNTSYSVSERPVISAVYLAPGFCVPPALPAFIFVFASPAIAKSVRQRLLSVSRATPSLENIFIEPVLTRASLVRVEILRAIRKALLARDVPSRVKRFDRSPLLIVTHDQRERFNGFVEACKENRSLLNVDLLYYAYGAAGRDFTDCLTSTFIVLSDGGQPVVSFHGPNTTQPVVAFDDVRTVAPVIAPSAPKRGFLMDSLSSGPSSPGPSRDPCKRPAETVIEALSFKDTASAPTLP